jgi:hypothetical protein
LPHQDGVGNFEQSLAQGATPQIVQIPAGQNVVQQLGLQGLQQVVSIPQQQVTKPLSLQISHLSELIPLCTQFSLPQVCFQVSP